MTEVREVFIFGVPEGKYVLHRGVKIRYNVGSGEKISQHMVEIFNDKIRTWQHLPCNEMLTQCPVCRQPLRAFYVPGTTWLACCSEECYKRLDKKAKELGGIHEAIAYFKGEKPDA